MTSPDIADRVVVVHRRSKLTNVLGLSFGILVCAVVIISHIVTLTGKGDLRARLHDVEAQNVVLQGQVADLNDQNAELQTTLDDQSAVSLCRSRAAFDTDKKASELNIVTARALAAVGRGESPAPFADPLDVKADAYATAIDDREAQIENCTGATEGETSP